MMTIINEIEALKIKVMALEMSIPKILEMQSEKYTSLIYDQTKLIGELQVKCADLKAIQMNLIASICVASKEIRATIHAHAEEGLSMLSEEDRESDYGKCLLLLTGVQSDDKIRLWLVPKRAASDFDEPNQL